MSSKHVNSPVDLDKPYEENEVGLKGVVYFGVGLLALIVITFALMWGFLTKLRDFARESAGPANPMRLDEIKRLPPEPRLQAAPGFGVDSDTGRVNLELLAPASEYIQMKKQWDELRAKGRVDPKTGMVVMMSVEKATEKFLSSNIKAKSGVEAEKVLRDATKTVSDSSAGRLASETRR